MTATSTAGRVGRFYTAARRHPWVLGKVADWKIPLGPYTPAQIAVAVGGGFTLVKSITWWSWMGPIPIAAWLLAIWAVRRPRIGGRAPMQAALGWALLVGQPSGGRIAGRAARDRAARPLLGGFTIEEPPAPGRATERLRVRKRRTGRVAHASPAAAHSSPGRRRQAASARSAGPVSGVQALLALAEQGGGR
ncbi:hypothetical protein ACIGAN_26010 [Streptomyces sp. NPDC085931]|uniref:hypothetical protein n=1 Tax=Streptomyces sp. NPDC085931 TaxID=3365740 RepID=UPI0037D88EDA